jgi:hypothetical protein
MKHINFFFNSRHYQTPPTPGHRSARVGEEVHARHCEELVREDWKKLMGNLPNEDIPLPQNHINY